ncbi:MAG: hypothetical protein IV100_32815 [Myxococcales bacterium]|nr:hypothetical protein [Myxococcales bacterium]
MRLRASASARRRLTSRATVVCIAALAALSPGAVSAHGAAPTVVDVLEWASGAPALVRLSRGLARSEGATWRYVCPTRWGGPDSPLVGSAGGLTVVAGLRGLMAVTTDGLTTALSVSPAFDAITARAIASDGDVGDGDSLVGLTTSGDLLSLGPSTPSLIMTLEPPPDAIVIESSRSVIVASELEGTLSIYRVRVGDALPKRDPDLVTAAYDGTPVFVKNETDDGPRYWIRSATKDGYRLDRLDGLGVGVPRADATTGETEAAPRVEQVTLVPVTTSADPIHGPVTLLASSPAGGDAGTYVVVSGQPHRLTGDALTPLAETDRFACIRSHPTLGLLACVLPDLRRYSPVTGVGDTVVALGDLRPPTLDGMDEADIQSCKYDWLDVAVDAGFPDELLLPPEWNVVSPGDDAGGDAAGADAGTTASTAGDCQSTRSPGRAVPVVLLLALAIFGVVRRRL